jgi:Rieske Fe-S protein
MTMHMNRRKFMHHSCICGLVGIAGGEFLSGCITAKYSAGTIRGSDLLIPIKDFSERYGEEVQYRKYVIATNDILKFPICVYRFSDSDYQALWTECTHQGNELQVFGEKLECPAHGSEFNTRGQVQEGPADRPLRSFPVKIEGEYLKISLRR